MWTVCVLCSVFCAPWGTGYGKGRLGSSTAWCARSYEGAWLQIDTGVVQDIAGVVTQGLLEDAKRATGADEVRDVLHLLEHGR